MHKVIFEVRTITPLFLAGADQTQAELRAPTFRGLMRYWQRALLGGIIGTDAQGLAYIQQVESAIFGTTDRASAVSIQVSTPSQEPRPFTEKISIRRGERWLATGKGYLLWSMARSGRMDRGNFRPPRWYFPIDTSFQVTLTARDAAKQQLKQAIAAFWLLTQLGGIGSRSRRCAGSLSIDSTFTDIPALSFNQAAHSEALKQQLEQGINAARALIPTPSTPTHALKDAHIDILARNSCRIWILQDAQPWSSAEYAMQVIGERLQEYRSHIDSAQRSIFGLPLPRINPNKRRASPLHLHIAALHGHKYAAIAVLFKTVSRDLHIKDYSVIEQWIDEFSGNSEVLL